MSFNLNKYKDHFKDKTQTLLLINKLVKNFSPCTTDEMEILQSLIEFSVFGIKKFEPSLAAMTLHSNTELIFEYAGSPIEKVFLNCLNVLGFSYKKVFIQFIPPINNYDPRGITSAIEMRDEIVQRWKIFKDRHPATMFKYFLEFLEDTTSPQYLKEATLGLLMYYVEQLYGLYFVSLQTPFNNIFVSGRNIRPDILIFSPYDLNFKLIVECDGYACHNDKRKFSEDRTRDRLLHMRDYKVFRFSGYEITKNPTSTAYELYKYLVERKTKWNR